MLVPLVAMPDPSDHEEVIALAHIAEKVNLLNRVLVTARSAFCAQETVVQVLLCIALRICGLSFGMIGIATVALAGMLRKNNSAKLGGNRKWEGIRNRGGVPGSKLGGKSPGPLRRIGIDILPQQSRTRYRRKAIGPCALQQFFVVNHFC